jgi:hypothetical protein
VKYAKKQSTFQDSSVGDIGGEGVYKTSALTALLCVKFAVKDYGKQLILKFDILYETIL